MDSFNTFATIKSGWVILYCKGSYVIITKKLVFLSLRIDSADPGKMSHYEGYIAFLSHPPPPPEKFLTSLLANTQNPDEMPHHYLTFHLGLHYLARCPYRGLKSLKD